MIFDLIYVIILGIIEGITEWMPISSTAHLIIAEEFLSSSFTTEFKEMFAVVIQLGAIFAVIILYFKDLWPFERRKLKIDAIKRWKLIVISIIPIVILGLLLDDYVTSMFYNTLTIAITLIVYGVVFIVVENYKKQSKFKNEVTPRDALIIGTFQVLAIIPGTSRSGITIISSMLLGVNRSESVKYSFFLSVPIMFGASILKICKYLLNYTITLNEVLLLLIGMSVAMLISLFVLKFFIKFIQKYTFKVFGIYRILLGIILLLFFAKGG